MSLFIERRGGVWGKGAGEELSKGAVVDDQLPRTVCSLTILD